VCFAEMLRVFLGRPYQVVFEPAENCPVHHVRVDLLRARLVLNLLYLRISVWLFSRAATAPLNGNRHLVGLRYPPFRDAKTTRMLVRSFLVSFPGRV
jgi:hypothetical protein